MEMAAVFFRRLLLLCVGIGGIAMAADSNSRDYLYRDDKDSPILEYTETNGVFLTSTKPRIVEFYSPQCGACRAFKTHYVELAKATKSAYHDVEFYGVSCIAHNDMCRKFNIGSYPSIYAFTAGDDQEGKLVKRPKTLKSSFSPKYLADALNLNESSRQAEGKKEEGKQGIDLAAQKREPQDEKEKKPTVPVKVLRTEQTKEGNAYTNISTKATQNPRIETKRETEELNVTVVGGVGKIKTNVKQGETADERKNEKVPVVADPDGDKIESDEKSGKKEKGDDEKEDPSNENPGGSGGNRDTGDGDNADSKEDDSNGVDQKRVDDGSGKAEGVNPVKTDESNDADGPAVENGSNRENYGKDTAEESNFGRGNARGRVSEAGALLATRKTKKMDRWQQDMAEKRKKKESKRFRLGKDSGKETEPAVPERMTAAMKSNTPGTAEFEKRRDVVLQHLTKLHKRGKLKTMPEMFTTGGQTVTIKKNKLPYKKDVKKPGLVEKIPVIKNLAAMSEEEELILDATMSFIQSLKFGVFMNDDILPAKKRGALVAWLDLLSVSLPQDWNLHRLIDKLQLSINIVSRSRLSLVGFLDSYHLPRKHYSSSCAGQGEYTCGLWKLFHVVSVGVAENKGGLNLVEAQVVDQETHTFSPAEAADTIRNFVENFLTCEPCREHFVDNYDDCENNRRCDRLTDEVEDANTADWKELSLWLWEVHNEVSVRIAKSLFNKDKQNHNVKKGPSSAKAYEISSLWPNIDTCLKCFHENGQWNEAEVFEFLERKYWYEGLAINSSLCSPPSISFSTLPCSYWYRPPAELDPVSDRLVTFDVDGRFQLMWLVVFIVLGIVYTVIGKNSQAVFHSVLKAKRMVNHANTNKLRTV